MYCAYCGSEVRSGHLYCRACGKPTAPAVETTPLPVVPALVEPRDTSGLVDAQPSTLTFFPVTPQKFIVMSLFTLGLYVLYWSYQNFRRIRDYSRESMIPLLRIFFLVIWIIPLLGDIYARAKESGVAVRWRPVVLGGLFILLSFVSLIPNPWSYVSLFAFLWLVPAVQTAQAVNSLAGDPEGKNSAYSGLNVAAIVAGGLVLTLLALALLSGVEPTAADAVNV